MRSLHTSTLKPAPAHVVDDRCEEYESVGHGRDAVRVTPADARPLRRQYSLEQPDDAPVPSCSAPARPPVRKQHSAGAAHDAPVLPALAAAPAVSAARYRMRRVRADTDFR
ncbi:hypothetical protein EVAR_59600_1 [Eumeta japonica]|uniref:Uncharacterized protein n=1 Tax=Eumeta variegata TaxID=151549 RepID=A0A4C1Z958_EUMVA|nr:hypothetical protein EVAR_59600_1 [Eumeta japonica]